MKKDGDLQKEVQEAMKWEPLLNTAEIGVSAKDGVITLSGIVSSYTKKLEAEETTKNVKGVKAVVEKIEVKFRGAREKDDNEITLEVLNTLKWTGEVPKDKIKVKVAAGWITLEGELNLNYQKEIAQESVSKLNGVKGVTNNIKIKSETQDEVDKKYIELALLRNWSIDNQDIQVKVSGSHVTLSGTVNSLYQKDEAERIAWNAPGVWSVNNELLIDYD